MAPQPSGRSGQKQQQAGSLAIPLAEAYKLDVAGTTLDSLALQPLGDATHFVVGSGEVLIAVRASGMNFRDVLLVLKPELFPDHKGDLGFDCAGTIASVG
jgi:NADPH:quinone reductase-like Zn-dependent oxidoreductase